MDKIYLKKVMSEDFCHYKAIPCHFYSSEGCLAIGKSSKYDCMPNYVFIRVYPENNFKIPE